MRNQKLVILTVAALGLALLAYLAARPAPTPLPPVSLLSPNQIPPQRIPLFARIFPPTPRWFWVWRLREKVLGRSKAVTFDAVVLRLGAVSAANCSGLGAPTLVGPDGLQIWRLGAKDLETLRRQLKQATDTEFLYPSRITTGDGSGASMSNGGSVPLNGTFTQVGLFLDVRPTLHGEVTDVITSLTWREAVTNRTSELDGAAATETISLQTNLCVTARLQLSNTSGVFLLRPALQTGDTRRVGMLLSTTQPPAKRPAGK